MKHPLPLIPAEEDISVPSLNRLASSTDRWRWMALSGVAASTAAVTPGAFADVVQFTQAANYVNSNTNLGEARYFTNGAGTVPDVSPGLKGFKNWLNGVPLANSQDRSVLIPLKFTDAKINNGAQTNGLLEVRAFSTSKTLHTVQLVRLVFDDASTAQPPTGGPGG